MFFCGDDEFVYIAINMHWEGSGFRMPDLPPGFSWKLYLASENDVHYYGDGGIYVAPRSVAIMVSDKK